MGCKSNEKPLCVGISGCKIVGDSIAQKRNGAIYPAEFFHCPRADEYGFGGVVVGGGRFLVANFLDDDAGVVQCFFFGLPAFALFAGEQQRVAPFLGHDVQHFNVALFEIRIPKLEQRPATFNYNIGDIFLQTYNPWNCFAQTGFVAEVL